MTTKIPDQKPASSIAAKPLGAAKKSSDPTKTYLKYGYRVTVALIVAVGGYLGNQQLSSLKADAQQQIIQLNELQCNLAVISTSRAMDDIESAVIAMSIDELQPGDTFPLKNINDVLSLNHRPLQLCPNGMLLYSQAIAVQKGLDSYMRKDYDEVLELFKTGSLNSLEETLIGGALTHNAENIRASQPAHSQELFSKASESFTTASKLAKGEVLSESRDREILKLQCDSYMMSSMESYKKAAVDCLTKLLLYNQNDPLVLFDLSNVSVGVHDFAGVIKYASRALDLNIRGTLKQKFFDDDFKQVFEDPIFGPQLRQIVDRYPQ